MQFMAPSLWINTYMSTIPILRDYQNAARVFNTGNFGFLPKDRQWFHVFFDLNPTSATQISSLLNLTASNGRVFWPADDIDVLGVLVKSIKLPSFKFETKKYNQYNRALLNTTKINYDPIDITFWDDSINDIQNFWYGYYSYMNQDPNYSNFNANENQGLPIPSQWNQSSAGASSLYSSSVNWGNQYGLDTVSGKNQPFFRSIRIYQFVRAVDKSEGATYNEFVLVNPLITGFSHDTQDQTSDDPFMSNSMSVEFETVLYNHGDISAAEIASWDALQNTYLDNSKSPLTAHHAATPAKIPAITAVRQVLNDVQLQVLQAAGAADVVLYDGASLTNINAAAAEVVQQLGRFGVPMVSSAPAVPNLLNATGGLI